MFRTSFRPMSRIAGIVLACFWVMGPAFAIETFKGFDDVSALPSKGWIFQNLSDPIGDVSGFREIRKFSKLRPGLPIRIWA